MKNNFKQEIIVAIIVVVLLVLIVDPLNWMPPVAIMMLLLGMLVAFLVFIGFVWREKPQDEREAAHRVFAGRIAFLVGTALLVVGTAVQTLQHELDPWLPVILGIMILAKIIASAYGRQNR